MRLTTLGTGTVALDGARVCAGHLVETPTVRLLLDCGSGVANRLAAHDVDWMGITHVAITHFHTDHISDLPVLIQAWKYGRLPPRSAPLTLIGPPGIAQLIERLAGAYGEWVRSPGFPFVIHELAPGDARALPGDATLQSRAVPHTPESVAYSIAWGGRRLVYTGDTAPDAGLAAWAAGCDVLLCECSLPKAMAVATHLTPEDCADLAAAAAPRHLVLTHFYPPVLLEDVAALIAAQYAGPVTLAHDGWHIDIGD